MQKILGMLAALFAASAGAADAEPVADIRSTLEQWTESFNAGKAAEVCDLFARDVIAEFRGQPERGYDDLCKLLQRSLQDTTRKYHYALKIKEIIPAGELAIVRLEWRLDISPLNVTSVEPGLDVFRRQADGHWRIIRYLAYEAPQP
jgi:ketosteroid isomerase-like protein